jgi:hypothetical protein
MGVEVMPIHYGVGTIVLAAVLTLPIAANAFDEAKYPDMQAQWSRPPGVGIQWDPSKRPGLAQEPPLTAEYQAIFEASVADQAKGGQGNNPLYRCYPVAMPRVMNGVFPWEIIISPNTTYMLFDYSTPRRIYTDGRDWPKNQEPTFLGYPIGKWIDENGGGRYNVLEVETRHVKGPHSYDFSGVPFHVDNQATFKERIYLDTANHDLLHDDVTSFDHALTRPWTVNRTYKRTPNPIWFQDECVDENQHVQIGPEDYMVGADGLLMPVRKGQAPPDLRHFK